MEFGLHPRNLEAETDIELYMVVTQEQRFIAQVVQLFKY